MDKLEWARIFQTAAEDLNKGDSWSLEFDNNIVPDSPDPGWQQYIRNTSARFKCSKCKRTWPSNRVMVVFHMRLTHGQGVVKVRPFRQNCKKCSAAPMEDPSVESTNIDILMENLVQKIRIKCYHEDLGEGHRQFVRLDVRNPVEPAHCEACIRGICNRS